MPADPAGMRFPHLYGPLPVTAVVAVVPYRPPAPLALPAPDDRLGRALAFYTSLPIRRAVGVGDVPGGVAVLDPDVVHSNDNNRLLLTDPVDADTVEAPTEEVGGNAGLAAPGGRRCCGPEPTTSPPTWRGRGWNTTELLLMGRPAARRPAGSASRWWTSRRCTSSGRSPGVATCPSARTGSG